jgi:hypothetical protein
MIGFNIQDIQIHVNTNVYNVVINNFDKYKCIVIPVID